MNLNMISIGERIKHRRKELNLSQIDIYEKCDITSGSLSKIENGKTIPSILAFFKLSQSLNCDINWLLTGYSSHMHNLGFCKKDEEYLTVFHQLSDDDQDEIIEIINLKLNKNRHKSAAPRSELSSHPNDNSDLKMV